MTYGNERSDLIDKISSVLERRDKTPHIWSCLKTGEKRSDYVNAIRLLFGGFDLETPAIAKVTRLIRIHECGV